MSTITTPFFYHPTQVLLLDDDPQFLNLLSKRIDKTFSHIKITDPEQALKHLQTNTYNLQKMATQIIQKNIDHLSLSNIDEGIETYDIYLNKLCNLASFDRFTKNLVVVVDRHMPSMDGLNFCQIVKGEYHLPVKLILLTGATTLDEAVRAFNHGTIDAYIEKCSSDTMAKELNTYINAFAQQQFQEISEYLIGLLSCQFAHIKNGEFSRLFKRIRQEQETAEYYLLDSFGSFLLLNKRGDVKTFLVRLEQDFEMIYEIAENANASDTVLQELRERTSFPFTSKTMGYLHLNGSDWDAAMVKMKKITNCKGYYSIISQTETQTFSFDHYLTENRPMGLSHPTN